MRRLLLILMVLIAWLAPARADEVRVAVAANFAPVLSQLAAPFAAATGHRLLISGGSSGKLYAQIVQGAPFDVLLSADAERPRRLEAQGQAVAGSRFTYARGRLVLWSAKPGLVDDRGEVLRRGEFKRLALANPRIAPYGAAARDVLQALGLWEALRTRVVQGEDIGQTFQFVRTGNAKLGFVAWAQVKAQGEKGSFWLVPETLHRPIEQQAVLLARARYNKAARAFVDFLHTKPAREIIKRAGYSD